MTEIEKLEEALNICAKEHEDLSFVDQQSFYGAFYKKYNIDVTRTVEAAARAYLEQLKTGGCHDYQSAMEAVEAKSVCGDIVSTHLGNGEKWYQTVFTKKEADAIKSALQIAQSLPATPNEMEG